MITKININKMDLLISLYIACIAISELMGSKTFPVAIPGLPTLNASVAIFVLPLIFTINDIITEAYGKERTRSIIRSGLVVIIVLLIFSLLATYLPASSRFMSTESAYDTIFGLSARFSAASLTAFTIAEFLDVFIFVKVRERFGNKALWMRNNVSNMISQLFDTFIFTTLAFYSISQSLSNNINFILSIAVPLWLFKCSMSVIETPLVYWGVKWLKEEK
ncbi:MAG: queuosine precursor transporter [Microgenomates group bacterium]